MNIEPYHCTCMEEKLLQFFLVRFLEKREFLLGFQQWEVYHMCFLKHDTVHCSLFSSFGISYTNFKVLKCTHLITMLTAIYKLLPLLVCFKGVYEHFLLSGRQVVVERFWFTVKKKSALL